MRILVTGGAGYIGSHTVVELPAQGREVVVVDDLSNASAEALRQVGELAGRGVELLEVNVTNEAAMLAAIERGRPEAVVHFPASRPWASAWPSPSAIPHQPETASGLDGRRAETCTEATGQRPRIEQRSHAG